MYVIIASNSELQVTAIGTPTGRPFTSEKVAERTKDRLDATKAALNFIVVELEGGPDLREPIDEVGSAIGNMIDRKRYGFDG